MSGYNVTFETIFEGSLCGKWPDLSVWTTLLAMKDHRGYIDKTPTYIHRVTGIPLDLLNECIERFMAPDPHSRTKTDDGRRLRLIDPERPWGWVVINHQQYNERARRIASHRREVDSGANAERMAARRAANSGNSGNSGKETGGDRRGPSETRSLNSQLSTNNSKTEEDLSAKKRTPGSRRIRVSYTDPDWLLDFKLAYPVRDGDNKWRSAVKASNERMREGHTPEEFIEGAKRYAAWCEAKQITGTDKVKMAATFLGPDKPFLEPWTIPVKPNGKPPSRGSWARMMEANSGKE